MAQAILSSTTVRTALIDYRAELVRLQNKYPDVYSISDHHEKIIKSIDDALYAIEGNFDSVVIYPNTCKV